MAAPPTKITAHELVKMDMVGRRFRSREGQSQLRGIVRGTAIHEGLITVSVGSVQRRQGSAWNALPDFEYQGRENITSIWGADNGRVAIDIMHIASIVILPPGA